MLLSKIKRYIPIAVASAMTVIIGGCWTIHAISKVDTLIDHPEFHIAREMAPNFTREALQAIADLERQLLLKAKSSQEEASAERYPGIVIVSAAQNDKDVTNYRIMRLIDRAPKKLPAYWTHGWASFKHRAYLKNAWGVWKWQDAFRQEIGHWEDLKIIKASGGHLKVIATFVPNKRFMYNGVFARAYKAFKRAYNVPGWEDSVNVSIVFRGFDLLSADLVANGAATDTLFKSSITNDKSRIK